MPLQAEPLPLSTVFHPFLPRLPPIPAVPPASSSSSSSTVYVVFFIFPRIVFHIPRLSLPTLFIFPTLPPRASLFLRLLSRSPLPHLPLSLPAPRLPRLRPRRRRPARANLLFQHCESPPVFADLPGPRHYKYPSSFFCPWPLASIRVCPFPSIRLSSSQKREAGRAAGGASVRGICRATNPLWTIRQDRQRLVRLLPPLGWKDTGRKEGKRGYSSPLPIFPVKKFRAVSQPRWISRRVHLVREDVPGRLARFAADNRGF